jgi:hypothetical protein
MYVCLVHLYTGNGCFSFNFTPEPNKIHKKFVNSLNFELFDQPFLET